MRMCLKCETIALGNTAEKCPNCGETLVGYQTMMLDSELGDSQSKKQTSEKHLEDIEKRIEFTVGEMGKIQKRIDDMDHILENQKNLKSRHDILERELDQLRHPAYT